ncbi:hypothetical protein MtrunA17_Chr7g0224781 [Medicago truncatula]|uniref:Uncharacterized protein n=1 Tax=Medicago truncatula TaxID=3880 RepID=A0A396H1D5_MEDTR|nr:hypothetical protein MtrunA17_Chr7g0224781 [Medicago truncatula]
MASCGEEYEATPQVRFQLFSLVLPSYRFQLKIIVFNLHIIDPSHDV